ncbi:MAG: helix-turn-helix transcriptional regulator [Burkholderiaceae bacterium]|nr:helix-turn-helix transcriptional regulator [Burkholderiaceae bacterium]
MTIDELIDRAATTTRRAQAAMAEDLGIKPARISEWKSGKRKPEAGEIAYFAQQAGMTGIDVFRTVAEIEQQLRPAYARVWQKALEQAVPKS